MKLWNESAVNFVKPTLKVSMPDGRNYEAKILHVSGNMAMIRVDKSDNKQSAYSWTRFWLSLTTIANCLNEGRACPY